MAKTIKYTGTQDRWAELPVTGSQAIWRIGQQESRSDTEAALLLASGLFVGVADSQSLAAYSLAIAAIKPRPLPMMSFGTRSVATGLSGINWRRTQEAPADFEFVRVGCENASVNPVTWKGSVAATSSLVDPSTLDGTIVPLTYNAASTGVCAAAPTGREYNASRSADNGLACLSTTLYSDWMLCPSIPRTDGGTLPAIGVTMYPTEAVAGSITRAVIEGAATFNSPGTTRLEFTYNKTGGDATGSGSGTGFNATAAGGQLFPAFWIETLSRNKGRVVMGSGDSTVYGVGGTSGSTGTNGWGLRGCAISSRTDYPCVWVNASWPGAQHKHWCATDIPGGTSLTVAGNTGMSQFERNLSIFKPTDVVILTWSTNDAASPTTPTAAEFRREFARAMYMAQLATSYGARVIFCTPFPRGSLTGTGTTNLLAAVAYVRAQLAGANLLDIHAILGDPVTGGYASGMGFDDSHPSEAGHAAVGVAFAAYLNASRQ